MYKETTRNELPKTDTEGVQQRVEVAKNTKARVNPPCVASNPYRRGQSLQEENGLALAFQAGSPLHS